MVLTGGSGDWMIRRALTAVLCAALLAPAGARGIEPTLLVGTAPSFSPAESSTYFRPLLAHVGKALGRRVEMVQFSVSAETDAALERRELDFALVGTGSYVRLRARRSVELLAAPQIRGRPFYYAYVIVPTTSPVRSFAELRGKRFAFTDPSSNTGRLVPTYLVGRESRLTPEAFFASVSYSGSHDRSIDLVDAGTVDGASVDSLVFDYVASRYPARVKNVRIVAKSIPFGTPPFVANRNADPRLRARIQAILLGMHTDPEGRRILDQMLIDRFVVPLDSSYDTVGDMEIWLDRNVKR
jgi:phosphonate transport system substrate-binding protein